MSYMPVNYDKHNFNGYFYEKNSSRQEMWWKSSEYREQNEGRVAINNVHFRQRYDGTENYNWKENLLKVKLPNIHDYSIVCDGIKPMYFCLQTNGKIEIKFINEDL